MARTAVVAGTATAVGNRVSRRQANRWAEKDQAAAYNAQYAQPQYVQPQYAQPQYAPPPPQYAPQPQYAAPAPAAPDPIAQLKELAELKNQGILTEAEFAAQKAKLLA
jgi:hypothetical protein